MISLVHDRIWKHIFNFVPLSTSSQGGKKKGGQCDGRRSKGPARSHISFPHHRATSHAPCLVSHSVLHVSVPVCCSPQPAFAFSSLLPRVHTSVSAKQNTPSPKRPTLCNTAPLARFHLPPDLTHASPFPCCFSRPLAASGRRAGAIAGKAIRGGLEKVRANHRNMPNPYPLSHKRTRCVGGVHGVASPKSAVWLATGERLPAFALPN